MREKMRKLESKIKITIEEILTEAIGLMSDRQWCRNFGIDYSNPNLNDIVKEKVKQYKQLNYEIPEKLNYLSSS